MSVLKTCTTCKRGQGKSQRASVVLPLPDFTELLRAFGTTGISYMSTSLVNGIKRDWKGVHSTVHMSSH